MLFLTPEERRAYGKRLAPYLASSFALFLLGCGAGLIIVHQIPGLARGFMENLAAFVQTFSGMPPWQLALAIFLNNSVKTLAAILLGAVLGIVPAVFLLANGVALGVALTLSIESRGLAASLASIVPHGVVELPAVFLGTSIGLLLGTRAIERLRGRSETALGAEILLGLRYFCTVILPLLLLAALVEVYFTAALASS
jgi:stage II sporulation protein M